MSSNSLHYFVHLSSQLGRSRIGLPTQLTAQPPQIVAEDLPPHYVQDEWVRLNSLQHRYPALVQSADGMDYACLAGSMRCGGELQGAQLSLQGLGGEGRRAFVYRALDDQGKTYALKVIRAANAKNLEAIQIEPRRLQTLADFGIRVTPVVESGSDYLIKPWVDGVVGDALLDAQGMTEHHVEALVDLLERCIALGLKIKDLKPRNLVFDGQGWICIDPGPLSMGETRGHLIRYYKSYVLGHWFKIKSLSLRYAGVKLRVALRGATPIPPAN